MTFGPHHYVPVLKIKRGEKKALQEVGQNLKQRITPLLEIVERKGDKAASVKAHLDTTFKNLAASVQTYSRCFLDAREIDADGSAAAAEVFHRASAAGMVFTPVTGITRSADVAAALSHRAHGLALRLTRREFEAGGLAGQVRGFMSQWKLAAEETDLIVDLGPVDDLIAEGVEALAAAFLADVPDQARWRTFTISACAFPPSMGGVARNSHERVDRADWMAWRDGLHAHRSSISRLPSFSDCAIQHPIGVEGFDPRTMQVSASVRYTRSDSWLLVKGESTRISPPSTQFPALATQLVYGHLRSEFSGAGHCRGCELVKASADGAKGLGSLEAWRRLGTIHHITMVVEGLAALPWP